MNNKLRKSYRYVLVVFLPITLLLVMIFILLYNFGSTSEKAAKAVVEDGLFVETENFALQIHEELDIMTRMGIAFRDMIVTMQIQSQKEILKMIGALCDNSNAYMVVYCDAEGIGFTHSGIKVNVEKVDTFLKDGVKSQYYAYLQKENIMQAEAVVSVLPIIKNETIDGYILMYYSVSHIRKLFTQNIPYDNSFLIFSVDNGVVITTTGLKEGFSSGTKLTDLLKELDDELKLNVLEDAVFKMKGISFPITVEQESKYVICIPVGINDWYVTVGYENNLYEQKLTEEWFNIRTLITYLLILIFAFVLFMIGTTTIIYIVYKKHNQKLQVAADTDLLTNLYNKVTTENKIKDYIKESPRVGAILFILDVDDFKGINDTMGHSVGDEVLKSLGTYLRDALGDENIIGRVGGDEFFVFLTNITTKQEREWKIKRAQDIFHRFVLEKEEVLTITFSVGAAYYPTDADNFEDLFDAADQALYEAKKKGKNQLVQYGRK